MFGRPIKKINQAINIHPLTLPYFILGFFKKTAALQYSFRPFNILLTYSKNPCPVAIFFTIKFSIMKSKALQFRPYQLSLFVFLAAFLCLGNLSKAQQPITLTFKNMLMPPTAEYVYQGADISGVTIPQQGQNRTWDYSKLNKNDAFNLSFSTEPTTNPVYPKAFRKWGSFFYVGAIPVALDQLEGNTPKGAAELGNHFAAQSFSLLLLTGDPNDSLIIPEQDVTVKPEAYREYPLEYGSATTTNSVYVTNFVLNIAAFGLDHVPGQFVQHVHHNRKVVGWGKIKIPTENGSSGYIRVLMQRLNVLRTDSVYLGGAPADPLILAAFGVTQGQTINSYYQYRFHQKGIDAYLANFSFTDDTYSTLSSIQYDTKYYDVQCDNGVKMCVDKASKCVPYSDAGSLLFTKGATVGECPGAAIAAVAEESSMKKYADLKIGIYPNPSASQFTLNIPQKPGSRADVMVYDISGRQVLSFRNIQNDKVMFGNELKPGTYVVQVIQGNNKQTIKVVKVN